MSDPKNPSPLWDEMPPISRAIWKDKYRLIRPSGEIIDDRPEDTLRRVANFLASAEDDDLLPTREQWADRFYSVMETFEFMPAGRIVAGAGAGRNVTLSNCLASDTLILTSEYGLIPIGEIAGEMVHVLDGVGDWVSAPINSFGEQPVATVTLRGGYNGRIKKTIKATAGHRWILADGSETTTRDLRPGQELVPSKRSEFSIGDPEYHAGVRHGIVYGDGSQRPKGEVYLRLCGDKAELLPMFGVEWNRGEKDGDTTVYLGRDAAENLKLKVLPKDVSPAYLTGFLRGWMATDGSVGQRQGILTCGSEELDWLRRYGAVAGMEVSFVTKLGDSTNYGPRNKTLFNVGFHRFTMRKKDFFLSKHRAAFEEVGYPWIVDSISDYGEPEPVFCPRVASTSSVTLDLGIHTGQCYVMGTIPDSMEGIFTHLKEAALTMQAGGGIGYDFSTIRPKGAEVKGVGAFASGPLSFMDCWDAMCRTVMSAGSRRGAMMATMRCDHPDILDFITAKHDAAKLRNFNVSVLCTDAFMEAVFADKTWSLVHIKPPIGETRQVGEDKDGNPLWEYKQVRAKDLWDAITRNTYSHAEPGVIFIDRINRLHNLWWIDDICATNPCLHPDSLIETIHGRVRIADITEPTMVYTHLPDGSLGVRKASAAFVSKRNATVIEIETANGKTLKLTPDHEVLVHAGAYPNWVKARDLSLGDCIVQLCRARRGAAYSGVKLTTEDNRAYRMEHRMVAEAVFGRLDDADDVHHIDRDTYNNGIDNLEVILHGDHARVTATEDHPQNHQIHGSDGKFVGAGKSPKAVIPMPESLRSNMLNHRSNRVVAVREVSETTDVYDLTVEETHNFIANFMVVHNCGEKAMGPYDSCLLGSVNLAMFVRDAFHVATPTHKGKARINFDRLREVVKIAIRMMDNVIDVNFFPLPAQAAKARETRQLGLGITGLADMLVMLGETYGSPAAAKIAEDVMREITLAAYWSSVEIANEKGSFPAFDKIRFLGGDNFAADVLPEELKSAIEEMGIRNSLLTSIAPTGTISLFMLNVSSGMEPIFAYSYTRKVLQPDGSKIEERVEDYAVKLWNDLHAEGAMEPKTGAILPRFFVSAQTLTPADHVRMQGALQKWVDSSISKTINCPEDISFEDFQSVYVDAWEAGCKGCTTYRPNEVTGSVLTVAEKPKAPERPVIAPAALTAPYGEPSDAPSERPEVLDGKTYKIKIGSMEHAVYVTVTHTPGYSVTGYDSTRPFEVFISTKDPSHQVWMTALSRMISAIFRRPHDSSFVPEELKAVFDPTFTGFHKGRQVPSVVAAIGGVIEDHMRAIGYGPFSAGPRVTLEDLNEAVRGVPVEELIDLGGQDFIPKTSLTPNRTFACPKCFSTNVKRESGCTQCLDCGHSKCG